MAMFSLDILRKVSKWTDDIQRDTRYFGVGTVNKQVRYPNGSIVDMPNEDRSFSYELKENEIFAYGVIDGYNGTWTVDFIEQCLLSDIYFDHLNTLQKKTDEEIYKILTEEFCKTEKTLKDNLEELLVKRSSISIFQSDLRRGTIEYLEKKREISDIDKTIESGAFATISLIINDRLFVANVGNVHCFVCLYDKSTYEKRVITLETAHSLENIQEMMRLTKLNANVQESILNATKSWSSGAIPYTRCLGDFKNKLFYHEQPQFKDCTGPPISSAPDHPKTSLKINDTLLFMAMYSDGLAKAIQKTDMGSENVNAVIARMLIRKIISEQTFNSAAQSVLDEIKRAYDDKSISQYSERDDFTLVLRVFDLNIKEKLTDIENRVNRSSSSSKASTPTNNERPVTFIEADYSDDEADDDGFDDYSSRTRSNSREDTLSSTYSSLVSTSLSRTKTETTRSADKTKREDLPMATLLDTDGRVLPYINLEAIDEIMNLDENREIFESLIDQLACLKTDRI